MSIKFSRSIASVSAGQATSDGAGVRLIRLLGQDLQQRLDPFLMLDLFGTDNPDDYIAGFPDHPHRGFETITYMLEGRMRHRDSTGAEGVLESGGVQWMVAGRGVIHSELPEQTEGRMEGFQLWLNLPASDKLCSPEYRDIPSAHIPEVALPNGTRVRVIAGAFSGTEGAVCRPRTLPLYLDIQLPAGKSLEVPFPASRRGFLVPYRGVLRVGETSLERGHLGVLSQASEADGVRLQAINEDACRCLLIAGEPLQEPIVQYGPFVMNSVPEIQQAISDYRSGRMA